MEQGAPLAVADVPKCRFPAFSADAPSCNKAGSCGVGGTRLHGITEAELLNQRPLLWRVVVVGLAATSEYAVYFRFRGQPGYLPLLKRKKEGVRIWTDFRNLQRFVEKDGHYRGPYYVVPEGWPLLARLGIPGRPTA